MLTQWWQDVFLGEDKMRIALFIIILFLSGIVSELKTMPNLVMYLFLFFAGCALGNDYYNSKKK